MEELSQCCGTLPKATYDTKLKKWFITCPVCNFSTSGHSSRKKAVMAWERQKGGATPQMRRKFKVDFSFEATVTVFGEIPGIEIEAESDEEAQELAEKLAGELTDASGTPAMSQTGLYGILHRYGVDVGNVSDLLGHDDEDEVNHLECEVRSVKEKGKA